MVMSSTDTMVTSSTDRVETSQLLEEGGSVMKRLYSATLSEAASIAASNADPNESRAGQRLLLYSLLIVSAYLFAGVAVYTLMSGMTVLDAVYFSMVTLTTVGYGDLSAHKPWTRLFACVYILVGVALIGALLARLVEIVLNQQEEVFLEILKLSMLQKDGDRDTFSRRSLKVFNGSFRSVTHLNMKMGAGILSFVTLILIGATIFKFSLDMSFVDAFYLTVVSASTVGYGDFSPHTTIAKVFAIFYLPVSTLLLAKVISGYTEITIEANKRKSQLRFLLGQVTSSEFEQMDENNDGKIDKWEYLLHQLIQQDKVTRQEIDQVWEQFKRLDKNNSGFLELDEVCAEPEMKKKDC
ncbi:unnamed protein product [Ascophyllum nodosum]